MPEKKLTSRERIVRSALSLFSQNGITATTTKEIAEQAGVNEVTLFRQFGSKQGLLLAVIKEAPFIESMQAALTDIVGANNPITAYGSAGLELLAQVPELVRSLIGEAGQSPAENHQALALALRQANQQTVSYLKGEGVNHLDLAVEESAKLLNTLLLGYALMEASSGGQTLWQTQSEFLISINKLFTASAEDSSHSSQPVAEPAIDTQVTTGVMDLPEETVRQLFLNAKKQNAQTYALVYVLFGAGLRIEECAGLMRSQVFASKNQHLLTISGSLARQVPVNRWIMGHRYGNYLKNPLTQWLKSRSDDVPAVFINEAGTAHTTESLNVLWNTLLDDITAPFGTDITPFHARQTWCIELLTKEMSQDNLSLLSGLSQAELIPYINRAKEKAALAQALAIDQNR
ncbi:MAG: TetR family transcriptional regulator [Phormidesmis sp.]